MIINKGHCKHGEFILNEGCPQCIAERRQASIRPEQNSEGQYSSEALALRDRVILGNKKLNNALEQLKDIVDDKERWSEEMECWRQANEKLSLLCTQLKTLGYNDCLYLDGQGRKTRKCLEGMGCRVCPSRIPYGEQELMKLPGPGAKDA